VTLRAKVQVSILSDLNFDNHIHGNAQFLGESDMKHMQK